MATQGILVVQPGWKEGDLAVMDRQTYQRHQDALQEGTRVLFYMKEPVDALVGEALVTSIPVQVEPEQDAPILNEQHPEAVRIDQRTYHLPYRMIRASVQQIPLGTIHARIGSEFAVFDDEWIPLSEAQYQSLVEEWENQTP